MTHYATCTNCAVDKSVCQKRANLREALKGQHVYSLKFKCTDRQPLFVSGQRVQFDWLLWDTDGYDSESTPLTFHGTVLRERSPKFVVQVDHGVDASGEGIEASEIFKRNDQLLVKVKPADMRSLDESNRKVCATCYWVEGTAEDRCYKMSDWTPGGCIDPTHLARSAP